MTDIDVIKGSLKQGEGKVQEEVAKATGSIEDNLAGKAKQVTGAIQEAFGHAKDSAKKELDKTQV
jgi:uncharacterized protein YjbJ (UPF0337 family)